MPWKIDYLEDHRVIAVTFSGMVSGAELDRCIEEMQRIASARGTARFLADGSSIEGGHTLIDLYGRLESVVRFPFAEPFMEALVLAPQSPATIVKNMEFWAGAMRQRGFSVQTFVERASALKWLRADR
jgi:hypothetical protein